MQACVITFSFADNHSSRAESCLKLKKNPMWNEKYRTQSVSMCLISKKVKKKNFYKKKVIDYKDFRIVRL